MKNDTKMCEKCDQPMKRGAYAHIKNEGEKAYKGPNKVSYCCMNENCENFYKNIIKIEN